MNGPDHFQQAEACLENAREAMSAVIDAGASEAALGTPIVVHLMSVAALHAAMAQAHATLALAAATAYELSAPGGDEWAEVIR